MSYYILNASRDVVATDQATYTAWFPTANRTVGDENANGIQVTTLFFGDSASNLFKTTCTNGTDTLAFASDSTWADATASQQSAVLQAMQGGWGSIHPDDDGS